MIPDKVNTFETFVGFSVIYIYSYASLFLILSHRKRQKRSNEGHPPNIKTILNTWTVYNVQQGTKKANNEENYSHSKINVSSADMSDTHIQPTSSKD